MLYYFLTFEEEQLSRFEVFERLITIFLRIIAALD